MASPEQRAERRAAVWEQLRQRRGTRIEEPVRRRDSAALPGRTVLSTHFLRMRAAVEAEEYEDFAATHITEEHIHGLLDSLRASRAPESHALQDPATPADERRRLLAEIATEQFREHIGGWLTRVDADHELGSSPVEDLERMRGDILYRRRLLTAMMEATQKELDHLELHIRAHRGLEAQRSAEEPGEGDDE